MDLPLNTRLSSLQLLKVLYFDVVSTNVLYISCRNSHEWAICVSRIISGICMRVYILCYKGILCRAFPTSFIIGKWMKYQWQIIALLSVIINMYILSRSQKFLENEFSSIVRLTMSNLCLRKYKCQHQHLKLIEIFFINYFTAWNL